MKQTPSLGKDASITQSLTPQCQSTNSSLSTGRQHGELTGIKFESQTPFCFKDFADLNTYTSVTYRAGITATFTVQVFILVTGILAIVEYKIGHFILTRT